MGRKEVEPGRRLVGGTHVARLQVFLPGRLPGRKLGSWRGRGAGGTDRESLPVRRLREDHRSGAAAAEQVRTGRRAAGGAGTRERRGTSSIAPIHASNRPTSSILAQLTHPS